MPVSGIPRCELHATDSICIVTVYFGEFPPYFSLFLSSCASNPSIDFLIVTDQEAPSLPSNVKFVHSSLSEFAVLAREKLNLPVCLDKPYKLCDFKPVYGNILEDFLVGYDYWGHCDVDLIFGDLRGFFNRYNLGLYDKFLPLGHLCLYRNDLEVLSRYSLPTMEKVAYKEAFCLPDNVAFDEVGGINAVYREYGFPMFEGRIFADISSIYHRFRLALDDVNYERQAFFWQDGQVLRAYLGSDGVVKMDEFAYIHFKKRRFLADQVRTTAESPYYIGPSGFTAMNGVPSIVDIDRVNPYRGVLFERAEMLAFRALTLGKSMSRRLGRRRG